MYLTVNVNVNPLKYVNLIIGNQKKANSNIFWMVANFNIQNYVWKNFDLASSEYIIMDKMERKGRKSRKM